MKEMFEKILADRLKSYFYRTFIITWLVVNWKVILIVLGFKNLNNSEIELGVIALLENYFKDNIQKITWIPLVILIILIFLLPFFDLLIAYFKEVVINNLYIKKIKYGDQTYLGSDIKARENDIKELTQELEKSDKKIREGNKANQNLIITNNGYDTELLGNKRLNEILKYSYLLDILFGTDDPDYSFKLVLSVENDKIILTKDSKEYSFSVIMYKVFNKNIEIILFRYDDKVNTGNKDLDYVLNDCLFKIRIFDTNTMLKGDIIMLLKYEELCQKINLVLNSNRQSRFNFNMKVTVT